MDLLKVDWDKAKAIGATADINLLLNMGIFEQVTMYQCYECGYQSTDKSDFVTINIEPAHYGMDDPYPGYGGDTACLECSGAEG